MSNIFWTSPPQVDTTLANCHKVFVAIFASSCHFASVFLPLVETVSELSNSFNLLNSFSSLLTAKMQSKSRPALSSMVSGDIHTAWAASGECDGPPGCNIAPTAVDREMLLGRTRKLLFPGMIRKPYRSPRLRRCRVSMAIPYVCFHKAHLSKIWFCASAA